MPKATVIQNTWLKSKPIESSVLTDSEKLFLEKGKTFYVTATYPDRNQHQRLELASPMIAKDGKTELRSAFGYDPHIEVEGEQKTIKLPVKYASQIDNDGSVFGPGWRQCNSTANCMLADYLLKGELTNKAKAQGYSEPESVYIRIVAKYGDTTNSDAQTKALRDLGIQSYFSQTLSAKDLIRSLEAGVPVPLGIAYKSSGHWILCVGYDPIKKNWLMHDPYGTRHGAADSYDVGIGGAYDVYSHSVMQRIFFDQGHEAGWGRITTKVKGVATGLPFGL